MLSASTVLDVWEAGQAEAPAARAVRLWQANAADADPDRLWSAPVGCRDAALLDLRAAQFGGALELTDRCPHCESDVEFVVRVADLRLPLPDPSNPPFEVRVGDATVVVRLPSCRDLAVLAADPHADLLERCLVDRRGAPIDDLLRGAVDDALAARDPQADLSFALTCPDCGSGWSALLDIAEVLWIELSRAAAGLIAEIDAIARVYHWSEDQILALSPSRRRRYLDLVAP